MQIKDVKFSTNITEIEEQLSAILEAQPEDQQLSLTTKNWDQIEGPHYQLEIEGTRGIIGIDVKILCFDDDKDPVFISEEGDLLHKELKHYRLLDIYDKLRKIYFEKFTS